MKRVHFIAIGGAAMHNLALALHKIGYTISGSDDEIAEPSLSRLKSAGLLPEKEGWFPEKLNRKIDAVILGMHARADNPELLRAIELGIRVYSYPEFLYEHGKDKARVVVGGSHGKTTITAMILHVLKSAGKEFDFMAGAQLEGFDTMVQLSDAPAMILEGDEYLSSPIDRRPKFHLYKAEIGLISGIAWDHINVFPVYEDYLKQFRIFAESIPGNGVLIYCSEDQEVEKLVRTSEIPARKIAYGIPKHGIRSGRTFLITDKGEVPLMVFGNHNLMNLEGARLVCNQLGISDELFYNHIRNFKGAARRLELIASNESTAVFKDFAHSPSKLLATTQAVKNQFPSRKVIACMELHTFSSLNAEFLQEYKGAMNSADYAFVYYNPHTIEHKKLEPISADQVKDAFGRTDLMIYQDSGAMKKTLLEFDPKDKVFLLMSSGTFSGMDLNELADKLTSKSLIS